MSEPKQLGDLQYAIMRVLWTEGECSAAEVHKALEEERGLAPTTIATMLQKMEKKGAVAFRREGRRFLYRPTVSEGEVRSSMVQELTHRLFDGDAGAFELALTTRPVGLPDGICTGDATPVACAGTTVTIADETLFGQPDLLRSFACGTFPRTAGEQWYALTLPAGHDVVITALDIQPVFDVCLWIFRSCGPDAECVAFVDERLAGGSETYALVNEGAAAGTWYVGVDAVRPPDTEQMGGFDIEFLCDDNVPTVRTSFGGLKSLYR